MRLFTLGAGAVIASCAFAQTIQFTAFPTDDVWVYENAGDPAGDYYLRAWAYQNGQYDLWHAFPPPSDASYSYLKWDLRGQLFPANYHRVTSAQLHLAHKRYPGWVPSDPNILLRSVLPTWSEATWDFLSPNTPPPGALIGEGDRSAFTASGVPFPVTFHLDSQVFEDYLNASVLNGELGLALTSKLNPLQPFGAAHYQFFSRDWPTPEMKPKLMFTADVIPGYRVRGIVTLNELALGFGEQIIEVEVRQPETRAVAETHQVIVRADGSYDLVLWHSGTYDIAVRGSNWLRAVRRVNVTANTTDIDFTLKTGDVTGDNLVDDADLTNAILDFGAPPSNLNGFTDLNRDRIVDDSDLTLVILNYGEQGQE